MTHPSLADLRRVASYVEPAADRALAFALVDEVEALRKVRDDVLALHIAGPEPIPGVRRCTHDAYTWPCATVRAITAHIETED